MIKRTMLIVAMAGVYVWIRRLRQSAAATEKMVNHKAESDWASEGGANPAATV
jgi:hypothetical protein